MAFSDQEVGATTLPCPYAKVKPVVTWLEIALVGEDKSPIPSMKYRVKLPNAEIVQGFLNKQGKARIENIPSPGECEVTFPDLDTDAWARL